MLQHFGKKSLSIFLLVFLLLTLTVALYLVKQEQDRRTRAAVSTITSIVPGVTYLDKPWTSSELTTFMKTLSDKVTLRHGKRNLTNIPQLKGFIYEYMNFNPDRAVEGTRLDSMHDGAWLGNALASAYRSSLDQHFLLLLNNYSLTFYPNTLNNSDKYFVLNIPDSQARVASVTAIPKPADFPLNPVSKGIIPYWWDDGESISMEVGDGLPLIGYKGNLKSQTSLHMEDDVAMMLSTSHQLTKRPDLKSAAKNLALANPIAFGVESAGQPTNLTKYIALTLNPGDPALAPLGSLPGVSPPPVFNNPTVPPFTRGRYYNSLYGNPTQVFQVLPSNFDAETWTYYWSLLNQGRQPLTDANAKNYTYLAYTNIIWNQLWFGETPRQPGLNKFDISSYPQSNEKFQKYYVDDKNLIQGARVSGQNMFFAALGLQFIQHFPNSWNRWRDEAFPNDTRVEIRWEKPILDGTLDPSGYSSPITISTSTSLRFRSKIDTLYLFLERPQGVNSNFTLFSKPDAATIGATLTINPSGIITAKGRNGTDDLITAKSVVTSGGKDFIEIEIPYTIVKAQKPWANAIDDTRLSLRGQNGQLYNLYFLSSVDTVKKILEKEMVEGLRFWEFVNTDWGMIPSGFYLAQGKLGIWKGFSDSGNYAHLINATAAYKEYLEGKKNWELFTTTQVGPISPSPTTSITITPTKTPTPTPTITPSPTRTPTPSPTRTPTPTPTPAQPTSTSTPTSIPVTVTVTSTPLIGDYDLNGIVEVLDFNLWRNEFMGIFTTKRSDGDKNGIIEVLDFNIWRNRFN